MPARKPGPSVKDPEMYEALRDDGASKEKAARISNAASNTSRRAVGAKGGRSGDYEDWTKSDLQKRAREIGIEGRSSMSKAQLIKALREALIDDGHLRLPAPSRRDDLASGHP